MLGIVREDSMQKDLKSKCNSAKHKQLKNNAKIRVDELQDIISNLTYARKEGQDNTIFVLEEQVKQMLVNWRTELNETSSTSSLQGPGSDVGLDPEEIERLIRLDEEDDATSPLNESKMQKHVSNDQNRLAGGETSSFVNQDPSTNCILQERGFAGFSLQSKCDQLDMQTNADVKFGIPSDSLDQILENMLSDFPDFVSAPAIRPLTPADFLRSKCALWDCLRPPQTNHDYCDNIHANIALREGAVDMCPVLRPGGIKFIDSILLDVLKGKIQGKEVGIPECDGAVSARSPWNAPELFDLFLCEGETIREWLFFDKPRKAFEVGNRKQRSLPDYKGRGWHESRKQVVNEAGLKRSYYMDPQPASHLEWHLFEYVLNNSDTFALYRLELKRVDGKKKSKGKVGKDPVAILQKQMGKLTADGPTKEKKVSTVSMSETSKTFDGCSPSASVSNQVTPRVGSMEDGTGNTTDEYVDILNDYEYKRI